MEETGKTIKHQVDSCTDNWCSGHGKSKVLSTFFTVSLRARFCLNTREWCVCHRLCTWYILYFSFCCTSYVSQGCDSAVHDPFPDSGGVQYECTQRQKLRFIIYLFASPYGIHIKPESTVTRFPTVQTYTECSTICGVSVPWLRLQLPHSICSGSSSEIKHALNRSNRGQPSDTFLKENISKTTTGLVLTIWLNGGMTEFACCLNFFKPEADAIIRNMNIQTNCLTYA